MTTVMSPAFNLYVTCLQLVSHLPSTCISSTFNLYLTCLQLVSYLPCRDYIIPSAVDWMVHLLLILITSILSAIYQLGLRMRSFGASMGFGEKNRFSARVESKKVLTSYSSSDYPSRSFRYVKNACRISLTQIYSSAEWERDDSPGPSLNDCHGMSAWSLRVGEP